MEEINGRSSDRMFARAVLYIAVLFWTMKGLLKSAARVQGSKHMQHCYCDKPQ